MTNILSYLLLFSLGLFLFARIKLTGAIKKSVDILVENGSIKSGQRYNELDFYNMLIETNPKIIIWANFKVAVVIVQIGILIGMVVSLF